MKIKILGSNGWYSTETGNTTCVLVESDDYYIVLDAGDGISKLDQCIKSEKPIVILLSHFHLDHIYGLHTFNKLQFPQPVQILGQPGTKEILNKIINKPFTVPFENLKIQVTIKDLSEGENTPPEVPFRIDCRYLVHADPCFGYRIYLDGKIISYCTDTGFCDNAVKLSQDAHLVISEWGYKSGQKEGGWPHLNPEDAASIAKQANAKKLLLMHFDASLFRSLEERQEAEEASRKIFFDTWAVTDGFEMEV